MGLFHARGAKQGAKRIQSGHRVALYLLLRILLFLIFGEDVIHRFGALRDDRTELLAVDRFRGRLTAVTDQERDAFQRDAMVGEQGHEAVPELPRGPLRLEPGLLHDGLEVSPDVGRVEWFAAPGREDAAGRAP